MGSKIYYKGEEYNKLESFTLENMTFVVCTDSLNRVRYFKHTKIHDYDVYTPLDRLIKVFPEYQTQEIKKLENIINLLSKEVEKNLKKGKADKMKSKIHGFAEFVERKKQKLNSKDISWYMGGIGRIRKFASIYVVIMILSLSGLVTCGLTLFNWFHEGKAISAEMVEVMKDTEIQEEDIAFTPSSKTATFTGDSYTNKKYGSDYWNYAETTMMSVDFSKLLSINSDTKGWIYLNDTNVNYPFVQGEDNSYYLNHSFDKSYNVAGWLFADYRSNFDKFEKNTVIYGHGRTDQVMFGSLEKTLEESWYTNEENQIIKLSTPNKNSLWQIISIYTIPSESYYLTHTFENKKSYQKFIDTMLSRSKYDFGVDVTTKDKLLTLSTCLDNNGNRIVVQAKLIKEENR